MMAYAGIGSRSIDTMGYLAAKWEAQKLAHAGWCLRSGRADGADTAFEQGARFQHGECDLFLPWPSFGAWPLGADEVERVRVHPLPSREAFEIAAAHHPYWRRLKQPHQALHARNAHQVLGLSLREPAAFVLCWTPDGAERETTAKTGGTGQAIRIAVAHSIPVVNMNRAGWHERLAALLAAAA